MESSSKFDSDLFLDIRKEFVVYLRYTKGYSDRTCYQYNSDLGIWGRWMQERNKDWQAAQPADVEQFIVWQLQKGGIGTHIVLRRVSCLSTFYRWAKRQEIVTDVPTLLADKPKRPYRLPIWLNDTEQRILEELLGKIDDLPDNIYGMPREYVVQIRRRYKILFLLMLNSGFRLTESLALKVGDIRVTDGVAKAIRVIGKGNKERLVPLPETFGERFGAWLKDKPKDEFVFAKQPGSKPPSGSSVRDYLKRLRERAGINKPITPHKLRHTYATNLLNAGAELIDIQALLGHTNLATTQIYTHVSEDRMQAVVAKLAKRL